MNSGKFAEYDYGLLNFVKYGRLTPPEIPLGHLTKVPIAMFVGAEDPLATVVDTKWEAN
jgi:hypothetical protein